MRSIAAIVSDAKDGIVPSHEECFWVMLALSGMLHFSRSTMESIAKSFKEDDKRVVFTAKLHLTSHERTFKERYDWLKADPQIWLGDTGNPFHPETKKFHEMAQKIADKALKKIESKKSIT
jgi:hypothetical protein